MNCFNNQNFGCGCGCRSNNNCWARENNNCGCHENDNFWERQPWHEEHSCCGYRQDYRPTCCTCREVRPCCRCGIPMNAVALCAILCLCC